ncbi:anthranilate synthase component I family protein [Crocinitomicaceae bacterium]|nr:anthranilate synthase component I family protein [Crocinitomicaceae bacterium]
MLFLQNIMLLRHLDMKENRRTCYLNSNDGSGILGFGDGHYLRLDDVNCFEDIEQFTTKYNNSYIFALFSYDLKNEIENLSSNNSDEIGFPAVVLWCPEVVVRISNHQYEYVQGVEKDEHNDFISSILNENTVADLKETVSFSPRTSKEKYLDTVNKLKEHIQKGDIYEVNYCQEYISYNTDIKYINNTYVNLNKITKAPFSCLFHFDEFAVFSCSPERFLQKDHLHLIAQPIKGTSKRGINDAEDKSLIESLQNDPKERSENIMIVDLMRNDLSKVAEKNTVKVDELCEIYSFETVHQMISTVSCQVKKEHSFVDILKATFPMGSMTGAPKIRALELIEQYEDFKRGLYSGSVGYISPNGDFDFNVIIRTMIYNKNLKTLSCSVGSAITIKSDAEREYEECQLKIKKMIDVFKH